MQTKEEAATKKKAYMKIYHQQNKEAQNKRSKAYYKDNKEKIKAMNRVWGKAHPEKVKEYANNWYHKDKAKESTTIFYLLKHAKSRAIKKNVEFSLLEEDITVPELCPILKKPLIKHDPKYGPSLDRKDPLKGYTKDNVWVISRLANAMKWDSDKEDRLLFAVWVMTTEEEF